jgi:hypothetical protein
MPWNHKQMIVEAIMMIDMTHYNLRCVQGMEGFFVFCLMLIGAVIAIFYAIFMTASFD